MQKKKIKICACVAHEESDRETHTHKYIHKRIAGGWKDREKTGPTT